MTAVSAYRTARPELSSPPRRSPDANNGPSEACSGASSATDAAPGAPPASIVRGIEDGEPTLSELLLTQWMAWFLFYQAIAAELDRKGRVLPTLGV